MSRSSSRDSSLGLAAQPRHGSSASREPAASTVRRRVLLIDDEPMVLRCLKRMLAAHIIDTAQSGREALEILARDSHYDVVLCDLMMPEMDGAAVYAELEQRHPELVERLLFCSGGASTTLTRALVERSARPLLEKPLTLERFEQAVASTLPCARLIG